MKKTFVLLCCVLATFSLFAQNAKRSSVFKQTPSQRMSKVTKTNATPDDSYYLLREDLEKILYGWTIIDADGDGKEWSQIYDYENAPSGTNVLMSMSWDDTYDEGITPDNWLITPALTILPNAQLTWFDAEYDAAFPGDKYSVYISETGTTVADFTAPAIVSYTVTKEEFTKRTLDLSSYNGRTIYIAFRHHDCSDKCALVFDDFFIKSDAPSTPEYAIYPQRLDFGLAFISEPTVLKTRVSTFNLTQGITATTSAPYTISTDSINFSTSIVLPSTSTYLYVKCDAQTTGEIPTGQVQFTSAEAGANIIVMSAYGVDCSVKSAPYIESFSANIATLYCWNAYNLNNDNSLWELYFEDPNNPIDTRYGIMRSDSLDANDWLVSPSLSIDNNNIITFDYQTLSREESMQVYAILNNPDNFDNAVLLKDIPSILPSDGVIRDTINVSQYAGQEIFIGFKSNAVKTTKQLPSFLMLDNFKLVQKKSNPGDASETNLLLNRVPEVANVFDPDGANPGPAGVADNQVSYISDGNSHTSWVSDYCYGDLDINVDYAFDEVKQLTKCNMTFAIDNSYYAILPYAVVIKTSATGLEGSYTAIGDSIKALQSYTELVFDSVIEAQYVRFTLLPIKSMSLMVTELELFGKSLSTGLTQTSVQSLKVYPTILSNNQPLTVNALQQANLKVFNMQGLVVKEQAIVEGNNTIELNNVSAGIYFVKVIYSNGQSQTAKVIVK